MAIYRHHYQFNSWDGKIIGMQILLEVDQIIVKNCVTLTWRPAKGKKNKSKKKVNEV